MTGFFILLESVFEFQVESSFGSKDEEVFHLHWLAFVQGEFKVPEDRGQDDLLLIQSKLLPNAVPGELKKEKKERKRRRERKEERKKEEGKERKEGEERKKEEGKERKGMKCVPYIF